MLNKAKFAYKVGAGIVTASLLLSSLATSAFADTTVIIDGNGSGSHNSVTANTSSSTTVNQSNTTTVSTDVNQHASTGGNDASSNTGGDTFIATGDATNKTKVSVSGGTNIADVGSPCGCQSSVDVVISGNGAWSKNKVKWTSTTTETVTQKNKTSVWIWVDQKAKTGHNDASWNTGGSSDIVTGNASNKVWVKVTGSSNTLNP